MLYKEHLSYYSTQYKVYIQIYLFSILSRFSSLQYGISFTYFFLASATLFLSFLHSMADDSSSTFDHNSSPANGSSQDPFANPNRPSMLCTYCNGSSQIHRRIQKKKPSMLCTRCNRTNHIVENCYLKHGFPLGYRSNNSIPS